MVSIEVQRRTGEPGQAFTLPSCIGIACYIFCSLSEGWRKGSLEMNNWIPSYFSWRNEWWGWPRASWKISWVWIWGLICLSCLFGSPRRIGTFVFHISQVYHAGFCTHLVRFWRHFRSAQQGTHNELKKLEGFCLVCWAIAAISRGWLG